MNDLELTPPAVFERPPRVTDAELAVFLATAPADGAFVLTYDSGVDEHAVFLRRGDGTSVRVAQRYVRHSPTGFAWGYLGSGPADLALNLLAWFVAPCEAWRLHQHFKFDFLASLDRHGQASIYVAEIRGWLQQRWADARPRGA